MASVNSILINEGYKPELEKEYIDLLDKLGFNPIRRKLIRNKAAYLDSVSGSLAEYDEDKVMEVTDLIKNSTGNVTLTMTSCKRFSLFVQTVNSFIACCEDIELISKWICIDDNSSEEDRYAMKDLYPFITFIFKTQEQKGHSLSMNMIKSMVTTPYMLHIEDDWFFFEKKEYIKPGVSIFNSVFTEDHLEGKEIGQIMLNSCYNETLVQKDVAFYNMKTESGLVFGIHYFIGYNESKTASLQISKDVWTWSNHNWHHFSLQPSLIKKSALDKVGDFDIKGDFELLYSKRWIKSNFVTGYYDGIGAKHIGRFSWDHSSKPNAYDLNGMIQRP